MMFFATRDDTRCMVNSSEKRLLIIYFIRMLS